MWCLALLLVGRKTGRSVGRIWLSRSTRLLLVRARTSSRFSQRSARAGERRGSSDVRTAYVSPVTILVSRIPQVAL